MTTELQKTILLSMLDKAIHRLSMEGSKVTNDSELKKSCWFGVNALIEQRKRIEEVK